MKSVRLKGEGLNLSYGNQYSKNAQNKVNKKLEKLGLHNEVESIQSIHANIFFKVNYELSDLLVQKNNSDSKIHIDSQGEGIKRIIIQIILKK